MNKFKTIKSYALYTVLAVCGLAIWYLGTAFVKLDFNFANWKESTRFLALSFGLLTSGALIAFTRLSRRSYKYNY